MYCTAEHARKLRTQYVCSKHFSETDFKLGDKTRLNNVAVPSLCTVVAHSHSAPHSEEPSSSFSSCEENLTVRIPARTFSRMPQTLVTKEPVAAQLPTSLPSGISPDLSLPAETSTFSDEDTSFLLGCANESACGGELGSINLQSSSPKCKVRHSLLKELGLDRVVNLTPREKKFYHSIRIAEGALCKLRKKYMTKNLKEVCHLASNRLIKSLSSSLNVHTSRFLSSIIRNRRRKLKDQRWGCDENLLALSILKRSPKSYRFLQSLFPLPSRLTLQSILNTVHFGTGISAHVFSTLKGNVQKMSDQDRVCCLMFDEMSLRENLRYNQKFGCIEGFEDLGSHGRTSSIANHVLVFMLRGLRKKWKQPVAYYLVHGSTKGEMLVNFLMEVLDACYNAGAVVVATVCDMGANNVKALKQLGVSEDTPFFRFQNQEIAAVFDPPHLLKCTRNLFQTHDVANVEYEITVNGERLIGTAKWEDILKLYEFDKCLVYHLLPKVTDSHVKPGAQSKRKVNPAAQVMSSKVAAYVNFLVSAGKYNCIASSNGT
jgi:hypothetical protein